jgi:CRISPR/Cas system CMR-associated protein Cmr1 (group 7 of RAMP superfamily)
MRKISARTSLKPDMFTAKASDEFQLTATLEFITPMFGGGVRIDPQATHHKAPDAITPVRGASLRGQLRTWWRRTCAEGLPLAEMQAR